MMSSVKPRWSTRASIVCFICLLKVIWLRKEADAVTFPDEISLRSALFQNYSKSIRPVVNQSDVLYITVNMSLYSIQELNAKTQTLKLSSTLGMMWENQMLKWDKEKYGGLEQILIKPSEVWIPDVTVYNGATGHNFLASDDFLIRLYHDGFMSWFPVTILETKCSIAIAKYPFDTQVCEVQFSLWMNPASDVQLLSAQHFAATDLFAENGEWDLIRNSVENTTIMYETLYSFFTLKLEIKRRAAYHVINTVLPILLLSILNVLVFVLPPEAGEKMSLSITVLLAYAVFLSIINENMPQISTSVSILAIYVVLILGLGTASTFLSAVTLHFAYSEPGRHRRFFSLDCIRTFRLSNNNSSHENTGGLAVTTANDPTPKGNVDREEAKSHLPKLEKQHTRMDFFSPAISKEARDVVDVIDIVSFWVFLGLTIAIFIVIICILTLSEL